MDNNIYLLKILMWRVVSCLEIPIYDKNKVREMNVYIFEYNWERLPHVEAAVRMDSTFAWEASHATTSSKIIWSNFMTR